MARREIKPLEPPDSHYLLAAEGWLDFGNTDEALAELKGISEAGEFHPDTLQLKWAVLAQREDWMKARDVADALVECAPDLESGWIHRAYATRRMENGSIETAWLALYPAVKLFPTEPIIPYNLACYACQLGRHGEAKTWIERAIHLPESEAAQSTLKKMALDDADLEPIWDAVREM